jgi:hypothetical protein
MPTMNSVVSATAARTGRALSRKASTSAIVNLPALRIRSATINRTGTNAKPAASAPIQPSKPARKMAPVKPRKVAAEM